MKVLIIQENGRHDGNREYRECFCLQRAFHFHNVETDVWGLGHDNYDTEPDYKSYDLIINLENYDETGWVPSLRKVQTQKFLWSIDAHVKGIESYLQTAHDGNYSNILQATPEFVSSHSVWFPNCYDDTLIKPLDIEKEYDCGFCGNINNREYLLHTMEKHFNFKRDIFVIGDDMVRAINSYRIGFNANISIDINYRNFETIGCNTVLLTSFNKHYEKLGFVDGVNCLIYRNLEELVEKTDNLLSGSLTTYRQMVTAGNELAKKHTYNERVNSLLIAIGGNSNEEKT